MEEKRKIMILLIFFFLISTALMIISFLDPAYIIDPSKTMSITSPAPVQPVLEVLPNSRPIMESNTQKINITVLDAKNNSY